MLQPWVPTREEGLVRYHVYWHVLARSSSPSSTRRSLARSATGPRSRAACWNGRSGGRCGCRSTRRCFQLTPVETRLLVLFWHLAERWGHVTPDGISVRLHMSHEVLGQLVGSQRASVTTGLRRIDASGLIIRRADGTWLLRGSPPDELAEIHWQQRSATG